MYDDTRTERGSQCHTKTSLSDLDRDGERSLTQQLVDAISEAIASGELAPGEQLPPTRELAELAGVNHLTAVRAYRRLRELGLVSAHVGRGTFVRGAAPRARARAGSADSIAWQRYALPEFEPSYGDQVLARDAPPGDRRASLVAALGRLPVGAALPGRRDPRGHRRGASRASPNGRCSTPTSRACPSCASRSPSSRATRGAPEDARDIV